MKKRTLFSVAAIALLAILVANPAFAATGGGDASQVGSDFFDSLQGMITGNIGFFIGLLVTVLGIWTWVIKQQTGAGVTMILGGVLITLAPGLFNSARNFAASALETVNADTNTSGFETTPN
jgi:type IV secretory pathway VirB2 component (pilin)